MKLIFFFTFHSIGTIAFSGNMTFHQQNLGIMVSRKMRLLQGWKTGSWAEKTDSRIINNFTIYILWNYTMYIVRTLPYLYYCFFFALQLGLLQGEENRGYYDKYCSLNVTNTSRGAANKVYCKYVKIKEQLRIIVKMFKQRSTQRQHQLFYKNIEMYE